MNNLIKSLAVIILLPILAGMGAGFIFYEKYKDIDVTITKSQSDDYTLFKEDHPVWTNDEPTIDQEVIDEIQEDFPTPDFDPQKAQKEMDRLLESMNKQEVQLGGEDEISNN